MFQELNKEKAKAAATIELLEENAEKHLREELQHKVFFSFFSLTSFLNLAWLYCLSILSTIESHHMVNVWCHRRRKLKSWFRKLKIWQKLNQLPPLQLKSHPKQKELLKQTLMYAICCHGFNKLILNPFMLTFYYYLSHPAVPPPPPKKSQFHFVYNQLDNV